jgi:hypothetical protein
MADKSNTGSLVSLWERKTESGFIYLSISKLECGTKATFMALLHCNESSW